MTHESSEKAVRPQGRPGIALRLVRHLVVAGGLLATGVMATGCATTASAGYYSDPELVYVSPGVQVIADWNEPIFYADGYYWRSSGGVWYRSSYYSGGWVYARPPGVILSIHSPYAYRHYRPHGWAPRSRPAPVVRGAPPPRAFPPPARAPGPGFGGPPAPMHAGPPRGAPVQPSHAGPPPAGPRARAPMMGRGPHR